MATSSPATSNVTVPSRSGAEQTLPDPAATEPFAAAKRGPAGYAVELAFAGAERPVRSGRTVSAESFAEHVVRPALVEQDQRREDRRAGGRVSRYGTGRAEGYAGWVVRRGSAMLRPWLCPIAAGFVVVGGLARVGIAVALVGGYLAFLVAIMAVSVVGRYRVGRARDRLRLLREARSTRGRGLGP
jgi:hypothetical protein